MTIVISGNLIPLHIIIIRVLNFLSSYAVFGLSSQTESNLFLKTFNFAKKFRTLITGT